MFYVEQYGALSGPYNIDRATRLCGNLNFINPNSATVRNPDGSYAL